MMSPGCSAAHANAAISQLSDANVLECAKAEGLSLVPSDNAAGYRGVTYLSSGRWAATVDAKHIGVANSPAQAALIYARCIGKEESARQAALAAHAAADGRSITTGGLLKQAEKYTYTYSRTSPTSS